MRVAIEVDNVIATIIEAPDLSVASNLFPQAEVFDADGIVVGVGWVRNGETWTTLPPPPPVFPSLSPRQIRLALLEVGITEASIESTLAGLPNAETALIEWRWATAYQRSHPLVGLLITAFNLIPSQVDVLWEWAATL